MNIGQQIIDEIIKQGMVQTAPDAPNVLIWSANAAEQLDAVVASSAEVEVPRMVRDLFAQALAVAGAPMGENDGDPIQLMHWAEETRRRAQT